MKVHYMQIGLNVNEKIFRDREPQIGILSRILVEATMIY